MSRRYRHGRPPHRPHRAPGDVSARSAPAAAPAPPADTPDRESDEATVDVAGRGAAAYSPAVQPVAELTATASADGASNGRYEAADTSEGQALAILDRADVPVARPLADPRPMGAEPVSTPGNGCTTAQLRRFIKSRPWVPMHELRRRFGINGAEDDVAAVDVDGRRVFVGLPSREATLLGELLRSGDIGVELSLDPGCPMVIGVYPMRPIPRG